MWLECTAWRGRSFFSAAAAGPDPTGTPPRGPVLPVVESTDSGSILVSHTFPTLRPPGGPVPAGAPFWNPQRGGAMPSHRYRSVHDRAPSPVPRVDRAWPSRRLEAPPLWVPVDLRDGNQALAEPMDPDRKSRMFGLFVAMGFKEIEVGYPSASATDFAFVRRLAETGIPTT